MDPLIFLLLNTLHFKIKSRIFQILRLSVDRSLKGCCLFYRTRLFLSKRSSFFSCFDLLLKVSLEVQTSCSLQPFLSSVARSFNRQHEQLTETHRAKGEQAEVEIGMRIGAKRGRDRQTQRQREKVDSQLQSMDETNKGRDRNADSMGCYDKNEN